MAIAASTSHGERACSSTSATHAPARTTSQPRPAAAPPAGRQRVAQPRRHGEHPEQRRDAADRRPRPRRPAGRRIRPPARTAARGLRRPRAATNSARPGGPPRGQRRPLRRRRRRSPPSATSAQSARRQQEQRREDQRDEDQRGEDPGEQHRRGSVRSRSARRRRQARAPPATCSLVRPKRRSRCRYQRERGVEGGGVEVRPQQVGEVQLGVRELPEQEVGDALLAAGADEQVRLRRVRHREERLERLRIGSRRASASASGCAREIAPRRLRDVPAPAVVGGDRQRQPARCPRSAPRRRRSARGCAGRSARCRR